MTPIAADRTRHAWRVSRNFARGEQASKILLPIFTDYYRRVQTILETMQDVLDADGPRTRGQRQRRRGRPAGPQDHPQHGRRRGHRPLEADVYGAACRRFPVDVGFVS